MVASQQAFGSLDRESLRFLDGLARHGGAPRRQLKPGTVLVRDYQGQRHTVTVAANGFNWQGTTLSETGRGRPYPSLSAIARAITGTAWSGPRFFTLARGNGRPSVHGPHHKRARAGRKAPATGSNITAGGAFSEQNSRKADPINLVNVQYYRGHRLGRKDHNRIIHTRPHGARVMPNLFAALCAVHEPPRGRRHHIPPPLSFGDAPEAGF